MRKFTLKAVYEEGPDYAAVPVKGSEHAARTFEDKLQLVSEPEEMMYLVALNTRRCPTSYTEVARGSLKETIVHPREIFKRAIVTNSHAIIIVHNHPAFLTSLQWCRCAESKRRCIRILQEQLSKAEGPLEACPQGKAPFVAIFFHCGKTVQH